MIEDGIEYHISGTRAGVAGTYNRSELFPERKAALERWATHVQGLVVPWPDSVVSLPRARRNSRGAPTSDDERAAGPDLVLGLALAIARLHTDKSVECAAAYRETNEEASSAWQADPEFGDALRSAYQMGETKPLRYPLQRKRGK